MSAQRIQGFGGIMPRMGRRMLPDGGAQTAYNTLLTDGALTPINSPLQVEDLDSTDDILTVYRMFSGANDYWLRWPYDVDVAKGPISDDTTFRVYYSSDSFEPRVTNLAMAIADTPYPGTCYVLGVTPPVTAPTVNVSGGSSSTETRAYVYTFVTQWGEESAPSPAGEQTGYINGTWNITGMDVAPSNTYSITDAVWSGGVLELTVGSTFGLRANETVTLSDLAPTVLNDTFRVASVPGTTTFTVLLEDDPGTITDVTGTATREAPHNTSSMMKRIYRTSTGSTTEYLYVTEIAVATTSYADTTAAADLGEPCETIGWVMPPATLQGLCVHPSGSLVGFVNNVLCMSEPLAVYAWPTAYQQVTDYGIVGIDVTGQSIVIGTSGRPYIGTGVAPDSFALQKLERPWPCLSKRSVRAVTDGVAYACPQGLAVVSASAPPQLVTEQFYTQKEWDLLSPDSFRAAHFDSRYYAAYDTGTASGTWVFGQAVNTISSRFPTALYSDPVSGRMYMVIDNILYEWMGGTGSRESLDWWSKEFISPNPVNLGAAKVDADFTMTEAEAAAAQAAYDAIVAGNAALIAAGTVGGSLNGASLNRYSLNGSALALVPSLTFDNLTFILYRNNEAIFAKRVTSSKVFRLPIGVKYDAYSVRIQGNVPVLAVLVGTTALALKEV